MTYDEWILQNPLKLWMDEDPKSRTQVKVASFLGITPYTVYTYTRGAQTPKKHWPKLIELLNNEELPREWDSWLQLREEGKVDFTTTDSSVA